MGEDLDGLRRIARKHQLPPSLQRAASPQPALGRIKQPLRLLEIGLTGTAYVCCGRRLAARTVAAPQPQWGAPHRRNRASLLPGRVPRRGHARRPKRPPHRRRKLASLLEGRCSQLMPAKHHLKGPQPVIAPSRGDIAWVVTVAVIVRLWIILQYPIVFGGDTILRLANSDRIVLAYQLPLLQVAIHWLSVLTKDPLVVRLFMVLVSAVAGVGFHYLALSLFERRVAFYSALLFVTSPFVLALSTVPYQEVLMLAGLLLAFGCVVREQWYLASLSLGLACLTRYEAWLACPVLATAYVLQKGFRPGTVLQAVVLYGWAPAGWMIFSGGLTPEGTYAVESRFSLQRFVRWAQLGFLTLKSTPLPVLPLVGVGVWAFFKRALFRVRPYQFLLGFVALFLVAILFSAHGVGTRPERFVTSREAHIVLVGFLVLAGLGLAEIRWLRGVLVALGVAVGVWMADRHVARATAEPGFVLSYETARYLDQRVVAHERVVVLARDIHDDIRAYLDASERRGGMDGRSRALEILTTLETSPPNYQRILVHSQLDKDRLLSPWQLPVEERTPHVDTADAAALAARPEWVVLWSDFRPSNDLGRDFVAELQTEEAVHVLERDGIWVRIYERR